MTTRSKRKTKSKPKTKREVFRLWFEQVNQTYVDVPLNIPASSRAFEDVDIVDLVQRGHRKWRRTTDTTCSYIQRQDLEAAGMSLR